LLSKSDKPIFSQQMVASCDPNVQKLQHLIQSGTAKNIIESFDLLDRLVDDDEANESFARSQDVTSTDLIMEMISGWKACWMTSSPSTISLTPSEILNKVDRYKTCLPCFEPNRYMYNAILSALMMTNDNDARHQSADFAQKLLERMITEPKAGNSSLSPDALTYDCVLRMLVKAGNLARALEIIESLVGDNSSDVDPDSFEVVLDSCLALKDEDNGIELADKVLKKSLELYNAGMLHMRLSARSFSQIAQRWAKTSHPKASARVDNLVRDLEALAEKDVNFAHALHTVRIDILVQAGKANEAQNYLEQMCRSYEAGDDKAMEPTTANFNAILQALGRHGKWSLG
jgi:hypothetical protein